MGSDPFLFIFCETCSTWTSYQSTRIKARVYSSWEAEPAYHANDGDQYVFSSVVQLHFCIGLSNRRTPVQPASPTSLCAEVQNCFFKNKLCSVTIIRDWKHWYCTWSHYIGVDNTMMWIRNCRYLAFSRALTDSLEIMTPRNVPISQTRFEPDSVRWNVPVVVKATRPPLTPISID